MDKTIERSIQQLKKHLEEIKEDEFLLEVGKVKLFFDSLSTEEKRIFMKEISPVFNEMKNQLSVKMKTIEDIRTADSVTNDVNKKYSRY